MSPLIELYLAWMALWLLGGAVVVCFFILVGAAFHPLPLNIDRNQLILIEMALGPNCWVASAFFLVVSKLLRLMVPTLISDRWEILEKASKPMSYHQPEDESSEKKQDLSS